MIFDNYIYIITYQHHFISIFIETNIELKKNLIVQIDYIKAMYSQQCFSLKYKIQQKLKDNILLNIDKFLDKSESIYGYNFKNIIEEDNLKYMKQMF